MLILVIYLLRDISSKTPAAGTVTVGAAFLVAVLHLWRSNALLSIFAGTALYVVAPNALIA